MSARAALDLALEAEQDSLLESKHSEALLRPFIPGKIVPLPLREAEQTDLEPEAGITHQLSMARRIQQSLLARTFPTLPGIDLAGFCHSAHAIGGDFYDVLPFSPDSLLIIVADVMGKGVPAALFASTLRTLVRTLSESTRRPGDLLARMNRLLLEDLSLVDMFITAQVAVADARRRTLVLANAGHCPLLLTDGVAETKALAPDGPPLGILPEATFAEQTVPLDKFTCALFYTDGLTDTRDERGELFGQQRLETWLSQNAGHNRSASRLKQAFLTELSLFQADAYPPDDRTFLLLVRQ